MSELCRQEETVGYIKGKIESIFDKFEALDKRLNGSFDVMTQHVKDSEKFRSMVTIHSLYFKIICVITIPVVIYLLKETVKHLLAL